MPRVLSLNSSVLAAIACTGSGLCVSFSFWPFRVGFVAYIILIPFLIFSGIRDGRGKYLLNSYLFGFGYFIGSLYWIAMLEREQITIPWLRLPAAIVLCLYLALFILLTGWLARRLVMLRIPYEISLALSWAGIEYLRSLGPLGFPWASLGYSQTPYISVIQQAAVIGTYGLSAWLVLINGLLVRFLLSKRALSAVAALIVFAVPVIGGHLALSDAQCEQSVSLSLVQPNISGAVKWDQAFSDSTMKLLTEMTSASDGVELVVWPETAVPFYIKHTPSSLLGVGALARSIGAHILFGFPDFERTPAGVRYYNSAMLISPTGQPVGEYRKIHLVPFGEMIPFEDRIELLRRIDLGEGDFSPGEEYVIFEVGRARFAVAICFESIYPSLVKQFVEAGADFIVNITNDEWFGPSLGPYQHAQMAIMRAVESRVGLARCANTGISMFVDPYGRITDRTGLFKQQNLIGYVATGSGQTPYRSLGHLIENGMLVAVIALGVLSYMPSFRRPKRFDSAL